MAQKAQSGDTVAVHYTGRLDDGTVFDSSRGRDPLEFELGAHAVIPGFENAVEGMQVGEEQEIRIPPDEAYGTTREDLRFDVPRSDLPNEIDPERGEQLEVELAGGQRAVARVTEVNDGSVTLDFNHPLAGETLTFDIELVGVRPAAEA